eukprot:6052182-Karenia_brevis.AAC.1
MRGQVGQESSKRAKRELRETSKKVKIGNLVQNARATSDPYLPSFGLSPLCYPCKELHATHLKLATKGHFPE